MRFQTALILIWMVLGIGETHRAIADDSSLVQLPAHSLRTDNLPLNLPETSANKAAVIGLPIEANFFSVSPQLADTTNISPAQSAPDGGRFVRHIEIRFIKKAGESIDQKDEFIQGRTKKSFLLDQLNLKPGQLFQESLLQQDLRRLLRLELFKDVKVSVKQVGNHDVDLIYTVSERKFPSLSFGVGNDSDVGIFTTFGYADENIGGMNQQLKFDSNLSTKDVNFQARFVNPASATKPERLGYSLAIFRERNLSDIFNKGINLDNGNRVREGRIGAGASLLRAFSDEWHGELGLNYTRLSIRDGSFNVRRRDFLGNPLSLSGKGIDDLFLVSLRLIRDTRDRRLTPTKGAIITLSTEQALPIGFGEISLNRLLANYIQYVPVKFVGIIDPAKNPELAEMIAFNLQSGTILGDFPPAEAFTLGGFNSVRGYNTGDIGSSRSYILGSVEYRFPVRSWLGGVVFTDFASDLGSGDSVLGKPAIIRGKPGSGFGYGIGVRVKSPVGLLRGDIGISDGGDIRIDVRTGQRF